MKNPTSTLIVTGNPNVGKSVIFQLLTGRYATVSNYPGTTVMVTRATATIGGKHFEVCDTPGTNSLKTSSEDELVARNLLLGEHAIVLQVAAAKNLTRALLLTLELGEAEVAMTLNLNIIDEARERRMAIDTQKLSNMLGIPVVPTIATERWGIDHLRRAISEARPVSARVNYPSLVETAVAEMEHLLSETLRGRRARALLWLSGDEAMIQEMSQALEPSVVSRLAEITARAQEKSSSPLGQVIAQAKLREAGRLADSVMSVQPVKQTPFLKRLGDVAMHPVWGLFILAAVLVVLYYLVGDIAAQRGVAFFENVIFGQYVVPPIRWMTGFIPWPWLVSLLVGEYGLLTMALPYAFAIILPIVGMFFLCFGFMEDVGYLPRLAVMANRFCRLLGLNGKAVLPLVLGLGCDTMATMTSRILDSKRDRIIVTLLLALGVPCSAQLGVVMAMLSGQPPVALWIWLSVVSAVLIIVGQLASRIVPGETSPFIYEIPPLRMPKLSNILIKTLGRMEWYIKEAVPLFFLGTLILFLLDSIGVLTVLERFASPLVVGWLGLPVKTTAAFLIGFLRRDFGAAGLYALQQAGELSGVQLVVSLVTITLFVPCIAQYFMMIKERGWKMATTIFVFVSAVAFLVGGLLFRAITALGLL